MSNQDRVRPPTSIRGFIRPAFAADANALALAQPAMGEGEEHIRATFEEAALGLASIDLAGRFLEVNRAGQKMLGYRREELRGMAFAMLVDPKVVCPEPQLFEELAAGKRDYYKTEKRFIRKDGWAVQTRVMVSLIRGPQGKAELAIAVLDDRSGHELAQLDVKERLQERAQIMEATVRAITFTIELRDPFTASHQRRVAKLAAEIAKEMGLAGEQVRVLWLAGIVHDIGKIGVPAEILTKPGPISGHEFDAIKQHPHMAHEILSFIDSKSPLASIALQHHERMDGSGYPQGLLGDAILLEARIVAVADVVEAMASHRPYRMSMGIAEALTEVLRNRGVLYDPTVVDACTRVFTQHAFVFD